MNEFEPPIDDRGAAVEPDADEAALHRGLAVARPVAVSLFVVGLIHSGSLLQIVLFSYRQSLFVVFGEVVALGSAIAFMAVGSRVYEGSYAFTFVGMAVAFGAALLSFVWFVALLLGGTITPLPLIAAGGSFLCGVACAVLVPFAAQISAARRRLFE